MDDGTEYFSDHPLKNFFQFMPNMVQVNKSSLVSTEKITATNEWQRFVVTQTAPVTTRFPKIQTTETGSLLLWGFQIEAGSYATSYIPTSGTTVARAAEVCNGAGTSAEFNDSEGVLFAEISALADDGTNRMISISNNTSSTRVLLRVVDNGLIAQIRISGVDQCEFSPVNLQITSFLKIALKYKANDFALWINGLEVGADTSGSIFSAGTLVDLSFDDGGAASPFYGKIKQVIAFDAALTDEELEDLTSWDSFEEMAASQLYTIY
jgi:hypothetical protein